MEINIADLAAAMLADQFLRITPESRLRQIVIHWRKVKDDPAVRIPSWFACLLNAADLSMQDAENRYADAGIQRDKAQRHEGTAANDMTTHGTPLKAGS